VGIAYCAKLVDTQIEYKKIGRVGKEIKESVCFP